MSSRECTDAFVVGQSSDDSSLNSQQSGNDHLAHLDLSGQISNVTYDANRGDNKAIWQKRRTYVAVKAVRISMRE